MKVFIEDYPYNPEALEGLNNLSRYKMSDGRVELSQVGYYFSGEISDSVFILPKVFLNGQGLAFGRFAPEEIIDIDLYRPDSEEMKVVRAFVFQLSVWIYKALRQFAEQHPDNQIVEQRTGIKVKSAKGLRSETLIDIVLELIRFNHEHQHLFTFITKLGNRGLNRINWPRTIHTTQPIIKNGVPVYLDVKNRRKEVNTDEELIVLFYSVLNYLREKYLFRVERTLNYELIRAKQIEAMIQSGKGIRRLKQIRRNYFSDEMVQLWHLLYVFFEHSQHVSSNKTMNELLLTDKFHVVFEAMIDQLISEPNVDKDLKEQKDGKIVDHIYWDQSLLHESDRDIIYFVADSKYYKEQAELGTNSLYKQFTYAKNIIQYNVDILTGRDVRHKIPEGMTYRDPLTEGYNITPNFFIRGQANFHEDEEDVSLAEVLKHIYADLGLEEERIDGKPVIHDSMHFENRLFDRDTLLTKEYNVNFLYVLRAYVTSQEDNSIKQKIRKRFREDMVKLYDERYHFRLLTLRSGATPDALRSWELRGQVFGVGDGRFLFAEKRSEKILAEKDENKRFWMEGEENDRITQYLRDLRIEEDFIVDFYSLANAEAILSARTIEMYHQPRLVADAKG